jgi:hypothetical protein
MSSHNGLTALDPFSVVPLTPMAANSATMVSAVRIALKKRSPRRGLRAVLRRLSRLETPVGHQRNHRQMADESECGFG